MNKIDIVAQSNQDTVVAEYLPGVKKASGYQSETTLEKEFISRLEKQGYEFLKICSEQELVNNLRKQLEKLNQHAFSDSEWERFFDDRIANKNDGILEKTKKIQEDHIQLLTRDDGTVKNMYLIDKKNIHNNTLQVINQYKEEGEKYNSRYDVTVLVNGLPLVHVELKRRGVAIREAFNQIQRYERYSFNAGNRLFEYVQIYVISNGTNTKYYSNTTRERHIKGSTNGIMSNHSKKTSNSFEFTSNWADATNKTISDLIDFAKTFFAKHALLNILTKYCVFTSEQDLLVMRPYQIVATERILNRILCSNTYKQMGTIEAGGYIWHTTGSGKTLTSFKTAQMATALPFIDKVLFVVDRKDLDYQTMKEYDKFEKGAANSNVSTAILKKQLENSDCKIIITTIQKLSIFVSKNKTHDIYKKHIVMIFDECHRSQFGDMHKDITKTFKNYHIFGFTGTPIFARNVINADVTTLKTTAQVFGGEGKNKDKPLHVYNIIDAIKDQNVLPFKIDYLNTIKTKDNIKDEKVEAIDSEKAMLDTARINANVQYVLEHFDKKTYRGSSNGFYTHKVATNVSDLAKNKHNTIKEIKDVQKVRGFNSIFAASSIPAAMAYYSEFLKQTKENKLNLKIATIFSFTANEEELDEQFDNEKLNQTQREFLEDAIQNYNVMFVTNYDTSADKFGNYYKDVSMRVKNKELDLLIVVGMFLTGFDATTLNTLWVDKNFQNHGLIQAFSRTNRILNSIKKFGNIICFRNLEEKVKEALSLFGDKEAGGLVLIKTFNEYYFGYTEDGVEKHGYAALMYMLKESYPLNKELIGDAAQKGFVELFGAILKLKNILSSFDEFEGKEILSAREFQDYQGRYIDIYQQISIKTEKEKADILGDIVFEIELVKQVEVGIDYVIELVIKYHDSNCTDKTILGDIEKAIASSIELRNKKELIDGFVNKMNAKTNVSEDFDKYVKEQRDKDLEAIIEIHSLKSQETKKFIENALQDGMIKTFGINIDKILPPASLFDNSRQLKKQQVVETIQKFFDKYVGLF